MGSGSVGGSWGGGVFFGSLVVSAMVAGGILWSGRVLVCFLVGGVSGWWRRG